MSGRSSFYSFELPPNTNLLPKSYKRMSDRPRSAHYSMDAYRMGMIRVATEVRPSDVSVSCFGDPHPSFEQKLLAHRQHESRQGAWAEHVKKYNDDQARSLARFARRHDYGFGPSSSTSSLYLAQLNGLQKPPVRARTAGAKKPEEEVSEPFAEYGSVP